VGDPRPARWPFLAIGDFLSNQRSCPADAELTSSPIAACEGEYVGGWSERYWFHRTAAGCMLGQDYLLLPDGKARMLSRDLEGTWSGDRYYFTLALPTLGDGGAMVYPFQRAPGSDSKQE
jgi:hypothetical protein